MSTPLERKIVQYADIDRMVKSLTERRDELGKELKALMSEGSVSVKCGGFTYTARKQIKDCSSLNLIEAEELLAAKGLLELCSKRVIDPELIEAAYWCHDLDDDDLRQMRVPKFIEALGVTRDVQEHDKSLS